MDLIVINGRVETMDAAGNVFEAVGIRDGKLVALGTSSDVLAERTPTTTVIDAAGRAVLPGFIEPHNHMVGFGVSAPQRPHSAIGCADAATTTPVSRTCATPIATTWTTYPPSTPS